MKKIALLLVLTFALFSPKAFGAESDLTVSLDTINFGHEGTEKTLYLTNKGVSDFFWSVKTDAPWLAVEPALGKIDNPHRLPANAPYQFSNMWPKLPQPWYFVGPSSVGIDHEGSIYVVDYSGFRITKFNKYEEFIFDLPFEYQDYSGPGHIAFDSENNFYVTWVRGVKKFDKNGKFLSDFPIGSHANDIAIGSKDNIYVISNSSVNKFDKNGNFLKSWGQGSKGEEVLADGEFYSSYGAVLGIAVDSKDNVYVADNHYNRIQKFDSEGKFIQMWAFTTSEPRKRVKDYQLGELFTIDSQDIIYIAHEHSRFIGKFDTEGNPISTNWPEPLKYWANDYLQDGTVDMEGNIYFGRPYDGLKEGYRGIYKIDASGKILTEWKSYDVEKDGMFFKPQAVGIDQKGSIYVYDQDNYAGMMRIQVFNSDGKFTAKYDLKKKAGFPSPWVSLFGMVIDRSGNIYMRGSSDFGSILKLNSECSFLGSFKDEKFQTVTGIAIDSKGVIYATCKSGGSEKSTFLIKLDQEFNILEELDYKKVGIDNTLINGSSLVIDSKDNIYLADGLKIFKFNSKGEVIKTWKYAPRIWRAYLSSSVSEYVRLGVDANDNIYLLLTYPLGEIQKFDSDGNLLTTMVTGYSAVDGTLNRPSGMAVSAQGNIYVLEEKNNRIQVFSQAVQPVKVSLDRSKLPSRNNEARLELYNDANASQAPVGVGVLAYGPNHAPELASVGNKAVDEGRLLEFTISATDIDSDTLTYSATGLPPGASFNPTTRKFSWTSSKTQSGAYQVTFNVSDGKLSDSETITIAVNNISQPTLVINQSPVAVITASPTSGRPPLKIRFRADRSKDPDGSIIRYLWNFGDGSTSSKKNPEHTFSHSLKKDVTYKVVLTVIDDGGAQSSVETTIVVSPKKKQSWWSRLWPF